MLLGVDYYPEQWAPEMLEADLDRILELGCNVIRIGEFAWHRMEPQEGEYDFSYFDNVIAAAKRKGLQVIFGTPTATPPAWLIAKHPEILSQFENGTPPRLWRTARLLLQQRGAPGVLQKDRHCAGPSL